MRRIGKESNLYLDPFGSAQGRLWTTWSSMPTTVPVRTLASIYALCAA